MSHFWILEVCIWKCFTCSLRYTLCYNNMLNYTNSAGRTASLYWSTCLKWFVCYAAEAEFCSLILCCFVTYTPQLNYASANCWCVKLGRFPKSRSKRSSALIGNSYMEIQQTGTLLFSTQDAKKRTGSAEPAFFQLSSLRFLCQIQLSCAVFNLSTPRSPRLRLESPHRNESSGGCR